jgi:hypothetical protein
MDIGNKEKPISSTSTPNKKDSLEKPKIHTTESGTQSVRTVDVVRSKSGWAEIQRLKEANLVRKPASTNGSNSSSQQSNDGNDVG